VLVVVVHQFGSKFVGTLGGVVSFLIIYVFEFIGHHHISLILIITLVVHSDGVNAGVDVFVHKLTQLHHVLYSTVIGDGHRVHATVHIVVPA